MDSLHYGGENMGKAGKDFPIEKWTAEPTDDGVILIRAVPIFDTKEDVKAYLDKLHIPYQE